MTIGYEVDRDASIVRIALSGIVDGREIEETVTKLLADPAFRPGTHILSDHSALGEPATTEMVRSIVAALHRIGERVGGCRCAVVVPSDAHFGMARMAEVYAEATPVLVRGFRTRDAAEAWLREKPD